MRKVFPKIKGEVLSTDSIFYLIGKRNKRLSAFLVKRNFAFDAIVEVPQVPYLEEQEEELTWKLPQIPADLVQQFLDFFRLVKNKFNSEALLLIYFKPNSQQFLLQAPEQENSPVIVFAKETLQTPEGYSLVGTIHSHPGDSFHSEKDIEDEFNSSDGIHIVVGNPTSSNPDFCCTAVVNGRRFELQPTQVLKLPKVPENWLKKIHPRSAGF